MLAGAAGWFWLGASGLALVVLWARTQWPLPRFVFYELDPRRIRVVRLGIVRVRWSEGPWTGREVFSDELNAADFAALRRFLKAAVRTEQVS